MVWFLTSRTPFTPLRMAARLWVRFPPRPQDWNITVSNHSQRTTRKPLKTRKGLSARMMFSEGEPTNSRFLKSKLAEVLQRRKQDSSETLPWCSVRYECERKQVPPLSRGERFPAGSQQLGSELPIFRGQPHRLSMSGTLQAESRNAPTKKLLSDVDVLRWYRNVQRDCEVTADVYLRRLGHFRMINCLEPAGLLFLSQAKCSRP